MNFKLPWKKKSTLDRLRAAQPYSSLPAVPVVPIVNAPGQQSAAIVSQPESVAAPSAIDDREIQEQRTQCITSHMHLAEVLGLEMRPEHEALFSQFPQRKPGRILEDQYSDRLILWPRGSAKTTAVAVDIVQAIIHNPAVRCFFGTSDFDLAKRRLNQIADFFDSPTETFQRLFPELCRLDRRVAQEFVVRGRTDRAIIDSTVSVSTFLSDSTGSHFDLIYLDDLVTFFNSRSETMRDQTYERYLLMRALRAGGTTQIILTGTVYDSDDAYGRIRKAVQAEGDSTNWLVSVKSCWAYKCMNCGHKDLFHNEKTNRCSRCEIEGHSCSQFQPSDKTVLIDQHITKSGGVIGYTLEGLAHERSEAGMGAKNFACQLENDCRPEAGVVLPEFTDEVLIQLFGGIQQ